MMLKPLFRLIGLSLTILTLALTLVAPVAAGGGEMPTGPNISLSAPFLALDEQGQVVVTVVLTCGPTEVAEHGFIEGGVSLGQPTASGGASIQATCTSDPQILTVIVTSTTGHAFHPGPVSGMIGVAAYGGSTGAGYAGAPIDEVLLPVQAGR